MKALKLFSLILVSSFSLLACNSKGKEMDKSEFKKEMNNLPSPTPKYSKIEIEWKYDVYSEDNGSILIDEKKEGKFHFSRVGDTWTTADKGDEYSSALLEFGGMTAKDVVNGKYNVLVFVDTSQYTRVLAEEKYYVKPIGIDTHLKLTGGNEKMDVTIESSVYTRFDQYGYVEYIKGQAKLITQTTEVIPTKSITKYNIEARFINK